VYDGVLLMRGVSAVGSADVVPFGGRLVRVLPLGKEGKGHAGDSQSKEVLSEDISLVGAGGRFENVQLRLHHF
jgi:hypothetical protein